MLDCHVGHSRGRPAQYLLGLGVIIQPSHELCNSLLLQQHRRTRLRVLLPGYDRGKLLILE